MDLGDPNTLEDLIESLLDPPKLSESLLTSLPQIAPDQFNKTLVHWRRLFTTEIPNALNRLESWGVGMSILRRDFFPTMERLFEDMVPYLGTFPLIIRNATQFITTLQKVFPEYKPPTHIMHQLVFSKLIEPDRKEWLDKNKL